MLALNCEALKQLASSVVTDEPSKQYCGQRKPLQLPVNKAFVYMFTNKIDGIANSKAH